MPALPKPSIYVIGSLRDPRATDVAAVLREHGFDVFDDWYAAGPEADDYWRNYEQDRGHTFQQALQGYAAQHVFQYDKFHLERCDIVVLVLPAGKSAHLELGWAIGKGKRGYILLNGDPERFDVMYAFADGVCETVEELVERCKN